MAKRLFQRGRLTSPSGYLSRSASDEFLTRLYFGPSEDYLASCMDRAYLDFNRTLHGFARHENPEGVRTAATMRLRNAVLKLADLPGLSQGDFDQWHRESCKALRNHYRSAGFEAFSYGQAQKWVNMTLKYVYVMGDQRLPGFADALKWAHVPIDNIVLETWAPLGMPKLPVAWSRLDDYKVYEGLQDWVRHKFSPKSALEAEFWAWMNAREDIKAQARERAAK